MIIYWNTESDIHHTSPFLTYYAQVASVLEIEDLLHAHSLDNVALGVKLSIDELLHDHLVDNVVLSQQYILEIDDLYHTHRLDGISLTMEEHYENNMLFLPNAIRWADSSAYKISGFRRGIDVEIASVSTVTVLEIEDLLHAHSLDEPDLTQKHYLTVGDLLHSHAVDEPVLTQKHYITVEELVHGHGLDAVALTQKHTLAINDALHAHSLDHIALLLSGAWVSLDGIVFYVE